MIVKNKTSLWQRLQWAIELQAQRFSKMNKAGIAFCLFVWVSYFTWMIAAFKVIWPVVMPDTHPIALFLLAITAMNVSTVLFNNCLMWFVYTKRINMEKYRTYPAVKWHWETDPQSWRVFLKKSVKLVLFNTLVTGPGTLLVDSLIYFNVEFSPQKIPPVSQLMLELLFMCSMADLSFYCVHRAFHGRELYWLHKDHHEYHSTIVLAVQHNHPIEFICSSLVAFGLGYKILSLYYPVHIYTLIVWYLIRSSESHHAHSGYELPWGHTQLIPFALGNLSHGFHHSHNSGSFTGVSHILDTIFTTQNTLVEQLHKYRNKAQ